MQNNSDGKYALDDGMNLQGWYNYTTGKAVTVPPIGTSVFVSVGEGHNSGCVIGHDDNMAVLRVYDKDGVAYKGINISRLHPIDFMPTEEKKLVVDEAIKVFESAACKRDYDIVGGFNALFEAGYLKLPDSPKQPKLKTAQQLYDALFDELCDAHEKGEGDK